MDIAKELNKLSLEYLAHDNTKNVYTTEVITKYISYDKDLVDEHRDEINGTLIKLLRILEQEYNAKFIADTISNGDFTDLDLNILENIIGLGYTSGLFVDSMIDKFDNSLELREKDVLELIAKSDELRSDPDYAGNLYHIVLPSINIKINGDEIIKYYDEENLKKVDLANDFCTWLGIGDDQELTNKIYADLDSAINAFVYVKNTKGISKEDFKDSLSIAYDLAIQRAVAGISKYNMQEMEEFAKKRNEFIQSISNYKKNKRTR